MLRVFRRRAVEWCCFFFWFAALGKSFLLLRDGWELSRVAYVKKHCGEMKSTQVFFHFSISTCSERGTLDGGKYVLNWIRTFWEDAAFFNPKNSQMKSPPPKKMGPIFGKQTKVSENLVGMIFPRVSTSTKKLGGFKPFSRLRGSCGWKLFIIPTRIPQRPVHTAP